MTTYKVSELQGALLDAAVAKAEGIELVDQDQGGLAAWDTDVACWRGWSACTDWRIAGPIIQRERFEVGPWEGTDWYCAREVAPTEGESSAWDYEYGPTPLIAAMRAYVASKFGDTVEMP